MAPFVACGEAVIEKLRKISTVLASDLSMNAFLTEAQAQRDRLGAKK